MRCFRTVVAISVLLGSSAGAQTTYYVNGACGNDSWSGLDPNCVAPDGPKATIQAGIDGALIGDTVIVAPGTYYENIDFWGKEVTLRSSDPNDADTVATTTIDAGGASQPVIEFFGTEGPGAVLEGLTITNGYNRGIAGNGCFATIRNCMILDNYVGAAGGGLSNCHGIISGCVISGNSSSDGGGLYNCDGSIVNAHILDNNTGWDGGGLLNCDGPLTGCIIIGNASNRYGGGLYSCDGAITNCLIARNTASGFGGGLYDCDGPMTNCTIVDNDPEGVYASGSQQFANCLIWRNAIWQVRLFGTGTYDISYSSVRGGLTGIYVHPDSTLIWGDGNSSVDPAFVDPDGPDDDPNTWQDNDYHLLPASPCVNVGDPNGDYTAQTDIDGQPRVLKGRVDMGADEVAMVLLASEPTANGTLPKTESNVIRLVFDDALSLPAEGHPFKIRELADPNVDGSGDFSYAIETTDAPDDTLKCLESGAMLSDQTWYSVQPADAFVVVGFQLDVCTLRGDAYNSGRVTTADYSEVKAHMGEYTDARYDLNGSGRVTTDDYIVVKTYLGNRAPAKP